jgi:hypothetical protein
VLSPADAAEIAMRKASGARAAARTDQGGLRTSGAERSFRCGEEGWRIQLGPDQGRAEDG